MLLKIEIPRAPVQGRLYLHSLEEIASGFNGKSEAMGLLNIALKTNLFVL